MAIRKLFEKVAHAIKWEHIDNNAVRENCIMDKAVTTPKYADNSIPETAYASDSVSNRTIAPSAIGTTEVQNGSITSDKLATAVKDKATIGLSNVDNTSDADKPISNATQSALDTKEPEFASGSLDSYFRGDKTFVRLDTPAVMAQTSEATGNLDNYTAPGIYAYQSASNLPGGSGIVGTLTVTYNSTQQRTQLLTDSNGFAWTRGYDGEAWSPWNTLTPRAHPLFYGKVVNQNHAAFTEERCLYTAVANRHFTVNNSMLTLTRAGTYLIQATSTGEWKERIAGIGRTTSIYHNGVQVAFGKTEATFIFGDAPGSWNIFVMALVNGAVGDTFEGRFQTSSNKVIPATHNIYIRVVE